MANDLSCRSADSDDLGYRWVSHRTYAIGGRMTGKPVSPPLTALTYSHNGKNDQILYAVSEVYLRS